MENSVYGRNVTIWHQNKPSQYPTIRSSWSLVVIFLVDQQPSNQLVKLFLYYSWLSSQWPAKHQLPCSKTHLHKLELMMMAIKDNCIRTSMTWSVLYVILIISYSALLKPMDDTQTPASSQMLYTQSEWSHWTVTCNVTSDRDSS